MRLITEVAQDLNYLVEAKEGGGKNVYIEGIFAQSDTPNRNKRSYGKNIMEREVNKYQDLIGQKRSLGELGHPENPSINLHQVSHLITSLRMEGKDVIGRAKILETPMGIIARNLIENEVCLGVSTRGLGSLKMNSNGINEVQDDFHLATVDIVADPSAPDAFVQGIMESAEWILENGVWKAMQIENAQREIKKTSAKNLDEVKLKIFEQFVNQLSR
jgi:Prohead core protein serine protease